ncbi:hypothetical protein B9Q11_01015 [Candidatus Marsarchaeota G2 archaeon ECH_B_SAG-F08]|uniref:Uncharacterized protein n=2 Tax=Candidatus Marsarchaeota group 2 TaxID=2203771 RepID=A0A2R6BKX1_9ARCH|nr:MAG: hypothetical protein B9Q11_01015 [Candidatus Marsarchaeota G2 archaeon ECH_B_SAG-F08]PSO02909.1 MAG: hypothetical protein B9Q10_00885 [Candidatus Marsarchaeota G2 archaeon ECH_B_SAG-E12]
MKTQLETVCKLCNTRKAGGVPKKLTPNKNETTRFTLKRTNSKHSQVNQQAGVYQTRKRFLGIFEQKKNKKHKHLSVTSIWLEAFEY